MPHATCATCATPIPAGIADCPHCGQHRHARPGAVHMAALGLALLGMTGCDFETEDQALYGAASVSDTDDTNAADDTQSGTDTEGDDTE